MRVTVLMENTAPQGLACEHGLALHIEYAGRRYLLDAGGSERLVENAEKLGVRLEQVDVAVLSHGHYDHSGGFGAFFDRNGSAPLYLRQEAMEPCYAGENGARHYIGVPPSLSARPDRLSYVTGRTELSLGVWLLPHTTPDLGRRGARAHMYRETGSGLCPDDFAHEQSLVFLTSEGLAVFSSCSHAGADTVAEEAMAAFPGRPVRAFFGGFHLMGLAGVSTLGVKPERVEALGRKLLSLGVQEVFTGHCTGAPAFALLQPVLGERLHYLATGMAVTLKD